MNKKIGLVKTLAAVGFGITLASQASAINCSLPVGGQMAFVNLLTDQLENSTGAAYYSGPNPLGAPIQGTFEAFSPYLNIHFGWEHHFCTKSGFRIYQCSSIYGTYLLNCN
jgi:hypothetical protein